MGNWKRDFSTLTLPPSGGLFDNTHAPYQPTTGCHLRDGWSLYPVKESHSRSDSTDWAVRRVVFNKVLVTYWGYRRLSLRCLAASADGLSVAITPTVAQASCARLRPTKPPAMRMCGAVYKFLQEFQWNCVHWAAMMETDSSSVTAAQYFFWKKRSLWHLNTVFTLYKCSISGSERR